MIARKSFLIMISTFTLYLITWVEFIIIIKLWGNFAPGALGVIGFTISFLAFFNIIADFGFGQAHIKRASEGKDLGTCIGTFLTVKIFLTILMTLIVIISVLILKNITHGEFFSTTSEQIIYILLLSNIISNFLIIPISTFTSKRQIVKRETPFIIGRIITFPIVILVATAGVKKANISPPFVWPDILQPIQNLISNHPVESLATTYVFSSFFVFLAALWFFRKYPIKRPNWKMFKIYLSFAMTIMFLPIIEIITININNLMIGYYWSSDEVGYYTTMAGVITIVTIFALSLNSVLFPTISELHSNKNIKKIKQTTRLAERYISMLTIPIVFLLIVMIKPFISIFLSDAFLPASFVLVTLSIFILINSINSPYRTLVCGMDKPIILVKIGTLVFLLTVFLNLLLIPKNGLLSNYGINGSEGAATSKLLTAIVGFIILRISVKKLIDINILNKHFSRQIFAGLVMGAILYFIVNYPLYFVDILWYHFLILAVSGVGIYLVLLFLFKEFDKTDLNFFIDLINPKKMGKYLSSELREKPKKP